MRISLLQANSLHIPIADKKVQAIVTSPPYFGLRDYGTAGQIGLEDSIDAYVGALVEVFRECRRVLRDDGVLWLNLGDSYNGSGKGRNPDGSHQEGGKQGTSRGTIEGSLTKSIVPGLKPKDLIGIPWRVALALQADGWWLRSDVIWHKPNPMPESVQDRPTRSHEYIFLLTKSARYFYDADAIREPYKGLEDLQGRHTFDNKGTHGGEREDLGRDRRDYYASGGRNKRTVWTITTKPYRGAHFAVFPPEIPDLCIRAGTSEEGACGTCGAPYKRMTEREFHGEYNVDEASQQRVRNVMSGGVDKVTLGGRTKDVTRQTTGWQPTCEHDADPVPQMVLDPFGGSGTTAMVANNLGRHGISLDLSMEYLQLARVRTGVAAVDAWEHGKDGETDLSDLPMFQE